MVLELTRLGHFAIDADQLAGWETASGVQVSQPEQATDEWLLSHRWVWNRARIEAVVHAQQPGRDLFLCGIAVNQRDMFDLFQAVFLLALDHETQLERLDQPSNAHRNAALRAQILDGRPAFERETRAAGAVVLDGRRPTSVLASRVLQAVG